MINQVDLLILMATDMKESLEKANISVKVCLQEIKEYLRILICISLFLPNKGNTFMRMETNRRENSETISLMVKVIPATRGRLKVSNFHFNMIPIGKIFDDEGNTYVGQFKDGIYDTYGN